MDGQYPPLTTVATVGVKVISGIVGVVGGSPEAVVGVDGSFNEGGRKGSC